MSKFEIKKSDLQNFLQEKYQFQNIDDVAYVKIMFAIEVMVFNLLNNALYIANSLKVKTIKRDHLMAILQIMKDYSNGKTGPSMSGGSLVMPSEYFGKTSDQYFDADVVSAVQNNPWDSSVTRTALDSTFQNGGSIICFITKQHIVSIIEKYKKQENVDFKVAKNVYDVIISSAMSNLENLFAECKKIGKNQKVLSMQLLYKVLTKNAKQFAHITYVLK